MFKFLYSICLVNIFLINKEIWKRYKFIKYGRVDICWLIFIIEILLNNNKGEKCKVCG